MLEALCLAAALGTAGTAAAQDDPAARSITMVVPFSAGGPAVRTRFADLSREPVAAEATAPRALKAVLDAEVKKWSSALAQAGVKPE